MKIVNRLNFHGDRNKDRGSKDTQCPFCNARELWLHVITCGGCERMKYQLEISIKSLEVGEGEEEVANRNIAAVERFLCNERYDSEETKMVFRGWIKRELPNYKY